MQMLPSPPRAGDRVLRAFETSCGVLRSLEVAFVQAAQDEDNEQQRHIACAIELVREAISEVRLIAEGNLSALAAGFVLPREPPSTNGQARGER
jgi:hypothetical protein